MKPFNLKAEQAHLIKLNKLLQAIIDCEVFGDVDGRKDILINEYNQLKSKV